LTQSGDTAKFRVVHEENFRTIYSLYSSGADTTYQTVTDTTWYTFRQDSFLPGTPFFADRNRFPSNGTKVLYHGDTLAYLATPVDTNVPVACNVNATPYSSENLSGFGQIERYYSRRDCGNNATATWSFTDAYRLREFNGTTFMRDDLPVPRPTAVKPVNRKSPASTPSTALKRHRVLFRTGNALHDLKGQRAPESSTLKAR
jgi:hypothetical protein